MDRTDIDRGVVVASEVAKSAWSTFSSWTSYGVSSITTLVQETAVNLGVEGAGRTGDDGDDGLSALTRNVAPSQAPTADPTHATRYGHIEHQAERRPATHDDSGLAELARRVHVTPSPAAETAGLRDSRYVGIGSSPAAPAPSAAPSATAGGFKPKRSGFVPGGAASGSQVSTPLTPTPASSTSPAAPTAPATAAIPSDDTAGVAPVAAAAAPPAVVAAANAAPAPAKATAPASDDWAWDD
jgi:hypothetical protein